MIQKNTYFYAFNDIHWILPSIYFYIFHYKLWKQYKLFHLACMRNYTPQIVEN